MPSDLPDEMKRTKPSRISAPILSGLLALLLCSCGTYVYDMSEINEARKSKKVKPEHVWNAVGTWKRVADQPPTYVPAGMPAGTPRTSAHGEWFHDERDGKRLFVPKGGVPGLSEAVLRKDAIKNTTRFKATPREVSGGLGL